MGTRLELGGIAVDVVRKNIKNIHLSVYPPEGRVRIAAPQHMKLDTIRVFAISKLGWIKQQQKKLRAQERQTQREYLDRESHFVWGKRYLLRVIDTRGAAHINLRHKTLDLHIRQEATTERREAVLSLWYREQIKAALPALRAEWEPRLGVTARRTFIQKMKTKWGSCSPARGTIRLNAELAKKPRQYLEYVVVHELAHLIERNHTDRFRALLDLHLPKWRSIREELNSSPLAYTDWS